MASYNCTELEKIVRTWVADSNSELSVAEAKPNNIVLCAGGSEMLKVAEDGFYVRGVKVPADDKEAETVYNAFKGFLVWSRLHKD